MTALWLFIVNALKGVGGKVAGIAAIALSALTAIFIYGRGQKSEGVAKGRRKAREEAKETNAKMADDVQRVLDDPNAPFLLRRGNKGNRPQAPRA